MPDQPPPWWEAFDDEALEYLHGEGRQRLRETLSARDQQDRAAYYLVGWTVMIVSAAGIFGDLRITQLDLVSALSVATALAATTAGVVAAWILRPRDWADGLDIEWLAEYAGAGKRELTGEALASLVQGFRANRNMVDFRSRLMTWLYGATVLTSVLVVAIQLVSAVTRAVPTVPS